VCCVSNEKDVSMNYSLQVTFPGSTSPLGILILLYYFLWVDFSSRVFFYCSMVFLGLLESSSLLRKVS
jgi:hypothetical protein